MERLCYHSLFDFNKNNRTAVLWKFSALNIEKDY